jgi:hypothetical protein
LPEHPASLHPAAAIWVGATVDPKDPSLFEFSLRIVAANIG